MKEDEVKALLSGTIRKEKRGNLKKRYQARVHIDNKDLSLGYYETEEEAREVSREYRLNLIKEKAELPISEAKEYKGYIVFPNGQFFSKTGYENKVWVDGGYQKVKIKGKDEKIHRVLGKLFIENPENKPFVNHIDGNPSNNALENLEWCTNRENILHARDVLGNMGGSQKLTKEQVKEIKTMLNQGISSEIITERFNITSNHLSLIRCGKIWADIEIEY